MESRSVSITLQELPCLCMIYLQPQETARSYLKTAKHVSHPRISDP